MPMNADAAGPCAVSDTVDVAVLAVLFITVISDGLRRMVV
jgi:hypothetical protein